jgi:orotate phosphoribosyltransferase
VLIALDRQELGQAGRSAVDEVRLDLGLPVASIVTMNDVIAFLAQRGDSGEVLASMQAYRERWGTT